MGGFFQLLSKVVQDFISPKRTWDKRERGDCLSSKMSMRKQVTRGKELFFELSWIELSLRSPGAVNMYRSVTNTEGISENILLTESLRPIYILKAEMQHMG